MSVHRKVICDRCGEERALFGWHDHGFSITIKNTHVVSYGGVGFGNAVSGDSSYDLCHKCQRDLNEWCKTKIKRQEVGG